MQHHHGYPDLAGRFGWPNGVHRAPVGYEHPWLVISPGETIGCWSRAEARELYKALRLVTDPGAWAEAAARAYELSCGPRAL